jgi:hypothetical protein
MPQPWYQLDWIWTTTGWALASLGAALLLWSLFADRVRRARRCPKCWYDMTGIQGLQCPECGRTHKNERVLFKRRRRWKHAAVAIAVLAFAWTTACIPRVLIEGWRGVIPTPALAAIVIEFRREDRFRDWPDYLRRPTDPRTSYTPAPVPWPERLRTWCVKQVENRVGQHMCSDFTRGLLYRWAHHVIDHDLDRYPPSSDWEVRGLLYAVAPTRPADPSQDIAPLVAPYFEIMPSPIEGEPVYAMVHAQGIGDAEATFEISTSWRAAPTSTVHAETTESFLSAALQDRFPVDAIIDLGRPPAGAKGVRVKAIIRRSMNWSYPRNDPKVGEREFWVPINVRPRSEDKLRPMDIEPKAMERIVRASINRYRDDLELSLESGLQWLYPSSEAPNFKELTIGAKVQILTKERIPIYEGETCVWGNQVLGIYPWGAHFGNMISSGVRVNLRPLGASAAPARDAAMVRLIGDPDLARQNPCCESYFRGTFEVQIEAVRDR